MRFRWTCPSRSLLIAAGATAVCCLCAAWAFQKPRSKKKKKKKPCRCTCSYADGGGRGTAVGDNEAAASAERQVGGSMMKQLVLEITTHALSYLDYTSLCCLSMTNSAMRRAANDDGVWKAPCHKDLIIGVVRMSAPSEVYLFYYYFFLFMKSLFLFMWLYNQVCWAMLYVSGTIDSSASLVAYLPRLADVIYFT